jgi:hypothetical protein
VYTHEGNIELCNRGFHACASPLDIFDYYPLTDSRFALVELSGDIQHEFENRVDGKSVARTIRIVRELTIADIITAQHDFAVGYANGENASSGDYSTAASSGARSTAASSGDYSKAASSGARSKAASSGESSKAASSGESSTAASSGDYSKAASSGTYSTAASSGYYSKAASSGESSTAASSGKSSTAASSGNYSKAASSGDYSKATCNKNGFACVAGVGGQVKGSDGSALSLGYIDGNGNNRISVAYVGEDGIEPDTWYCINNGKFEKL